MTVKPTLDDSCFKCVVNKDEERFLKGFGTWPEDWVSPKDGQIIGAPQWSNNSGGMINHTASRELEEGNFSLYWYMAVWKMTGPCQRLLALRKVMPRTGEDWVMRQRRLHKGCISVEQGEGVCEGGLKERSRKKVL